MLANYQVKSDTKPDKYKIENILNKNCDIIINDDIREIEETIAEENEIKKIYVYNSYRVSTIFRDNLEDELKSEEGFKQWADIVRQQYYNEKATEVRNRRDKLLAETDWTQMADISLSTIMKNKYKTYRQLLRDIPEESEFPYCVIWPVL